MRVAILVLAIGCASSKPKPAAAPNAVAICGDKRCIETHVGQVIDLAGTFPAASDPKRKGKHMHRVALLDGTSIILHAKHAKLTGDRDGRPIMVRGIVYTTEIPDRYGIIQRTSDPYCVEIYDVR